MKKSFTKREYTPEDNPYDSYLYNHLCAKLPDWNKLTVKEKLELTENNQKLLRYLDFYGIDKSIILTEYFPFINYYVPFYLAFKS